MISQTTQPKSLENRFNGNSRSSILDIALGSSLNGLYNALGRDVKVAIFDKGSRKVHTPQITPGNSRKDYLCGINDAVQEWAANNTNGDSSPCVGILGTTLSLVLDRKLSDLTDSNRELVYSFVGDTLEPALQDYFEPERETERLRKQLIYDTQFYKQGIPVHTKAFGEDALRGKLNRISGARNVSAPHDDLSVLVIDIDRFKSVNDRYGHLSGDQVIYAVAQTIIDSVRADDLVARNGAGDEYLVVLNGCDPDNASKRAESIRKAVASLNLTLEPRPGNVVNYSPTISVGGYSVSNLEGELTVTNLVANADRALYDAKKGGRNKVVFGGATIDTSEDTTPSLLGRTSGALRNFGGKVKGLFNFAKPVENVEAREPFAYLSKDYSDELTQTVKRSNTVPFGYLSPDYDSDWTRLVRDENKEGAKVVKSTYKNHLEPFAYLSGNFHL